MMNFPKLELESTGYGGLPMADEKDFREPDGATQDYRDEVFELAFEIDAFLRAHNLKYRTKFSINKGSVKYLVDKMLESLAHFILNISHIFRIGNEATH